MKLFGTIEKFDAQPDGSVIVEGVASNELPDSQGEIVKADAMRDAICGFMQWANIREMHRPSAVGTALECKVDEKGQTNLRARIVDSEAVKKVMAGVYKAFSIGGSMLAKSGNAITRLILSEISLVDRPAGNLPAFTIAKAEKADDAPLSVEKLMTPETLAKVEALPDLISKLVDRIDALEKRPAPAADLTPLTEKIAKLEGAITATQAATEENLRKEVIAKMDREGRAPVNAATGVGYKADELAKLDLPTLRILAVNSPIVPTRSRSESTQTGPQRKTEEFRKVDGSTAKDPNRLAKAFDASFPTFNSLRATVAAGGELQ
jgi:hypothetical protein